MERVHTDHSFTVSGSAAIAVPAHFALPAVEMILKEFAQKPGRASLGLNVRQMHLPFQATICVAVDADVCPGEARNEWRLQIRAAPLYPMFQGLLRLLPAEQSGAQLQIDGRYRVPFGALGRALDATVMRGAAESSLQRFVREIAYRVAALARWALPD